MKAYEFKDFIKSTASAEHLEPLVKFNPDFVQVLHLLLVRQFLSLPQRFDIIRNLGQSGSLQSMLFPHVLDHLLLLFSLHYYLLGLPLSLLFLFLRHLSDFFALSEPHFDLFDVSFHGGPLVVSLQSFEAEDLLQSFDLVQLLRLHLLVLLLLQRRFYFLNVSSSAFEERFLVVELETGKHIDLSVTLPEEPYQLPHSLNETQVVVVSLGVLEELDEQLFVPLRNDLLLKQVQHEALHVLVAYFQQNVGAEGKAVRVLLEFVFQFQLFVGGVQ